MDPEEKELFKKLLSKMESLEKEISEMKKEQSLSRVEGDLVFPPIKTQDKLARALIEGAREKIRRDKGSSEGNERTQKEMVEEIRKNYSLGEVAAFALKKKMLKEGREEEGVSEGEKVRVFVEK